MLIVGLVVGVRHDISGPEKVRSGRAVSAASSGIRGMFRVLSKEWDGRDGGATYTEIFYKVKHKQYCGRERLLIGVGFLISHFW